MVPNEVGLLFHMFCRFDNTKKLIEELLLEYLYRHGAKLLDKFSSRGTSVYLFDLSKFFVKK